MLERAEAPGHAGRPRLAQPDGWNERVALAEALNAKVITDLKIGAVSRPIIRSMPAPRHPTRWCPSDRRASRKRISSSPSTASTSTACCAARSAAMCRRRRSSRSAPTSTSTAAGAWTTRRCRRSTCCWRPRRTRWCLGCWRRSAAPRRASRSGRPAEGGEYRAPDGPLRVDDLARALRTAVGERAATLTHLPLSWNGAVWPFRHPLDYIGSEGGGGVGGGPGIRSARRSR